MSKQPNAVEKVLIDIVREQESFYYDKISKLIEEDAFKVHVEKSKFEMVGKAVVTLEDGKTVDYKIMYNRIENIPDDYTLVVR